MDIIRQNKIARLLQKEMAEIFQKESRNIFNGNIISVTMVRISSDLSIAKVYLSIFNDKEKSSIVDLAKGQHSYIRKLLGMKIKNQVRKIPELHFYLDDSIEYAEQIEDLLKK